MFVSLQLSLLMKRDLTMQIGSNPIIFLDVIIFIALLIVWAYAISIVQICYTSENPTEIKSKSREAVVIGFLTISIELIWRSIFG